MQENDGLIERWKRGHMENIVELHNKAPVWNEGRSLPVSLTATTLIDSRYDLCSLLCAFVKAFSGSCRDDR